MPHSAGCSATTIQSVLGLVKATGIEWPLPSEMDNEVFRRALCLPKPADESGEAVIDHHYAGDQLKSRDVTLALLWSEYCDATLSWSDCAFAQAFWRMDVEAWITVNMEMIVGVVERQARRPKGPATCGHVWQGSCNRADAKVAERPSFRFLLPWC